MVHTKADEALAKAEETTTQLNELKVLIQDLGSKFQIVSTFIESMKSNIETVTKTVDTLGTTLNQKFDDLNVSTVKLTARMEEVETLGTTLNSKIDDLTESTGKLTTRVEQVNTDIRNDLQQIETKFDGQFEQLVKEDAAIRKDIIDNKAEINLKTDALARELEESYKVLAIERAKFTALEKSSQTNIQHSREWNVEIDGIPEEVGDDADDLEEAVLKLCKALNVDIEHFEIDTVHRLPSRNSPKPVIVRFMTRKTVRALHYNKNKLKYLNDLDIDIAGLDDDSRIYIRPSLSPYFNNLSFNCRVLKRNRLIRREKVSGKGKLSVELMDGNILKVMHSSDLTKNFPLFDKFKFEYDRLQRSDDGEDSLR